MASHARSLRLLLFSNAPILRKIRVSYCSMNRKTRYWTLLSGALALVVLLCSCHTRNRSRASARDKNLPPIILWAWEQPEDLEFLDPHRFGVAFLAQTLILQNDEVISRRRRQLLRGVVSSNLLLRSIVTGAVVAAQSQ